MGFTPLEEAKLKAIIESFDSGKNISELPSAGTITGNETVELIQAGVSKKAPVSAFAGGESLWENSGTSDGWYLPSGNEMLLVLSNLCATQVDAESHGFTWDREYWTSTEINATQANYVKTSYTYLATQNKNGALYLSRKVRTFTSETNINIGETGELGIVFHKNGTLYKECFTSDNEVMRWSNVMTACGATSLDDGASNTTLIVSQTGHETSAAFLCSGYSNLITPENDKKVSINDILGGAKDIEVVHKSGDENIAGQKTANDGWHFKKGAIFNGQATPFPTGLGDYVAHYFSTAYSVCRSLAYNGAAYKDYALGALITAKNKFSLVLKTDGKAEFGNDVAVDGNLAATNLSGKNDGKEQMKAFLSKYNEDAEAGIELPTESVKSRFAILKDDIFINSTAGTIMPTIVDIKKNGVSILTTRLNIPVGATSNDNTHTLVVEPTIFEIGDERTFHVDQVGGGTKDLIYSEIQRKV